MANWYRNPQDPNEAVNVDQLVSLTVRDRWGDDPSAWFVIGDYYLAQVDGSRRVHGLVAGPFDSEGEALAVLTGIVGAVD